MFAILIGIIIVLAVLLVLVILGQNSKGGAGAAFGGSASQIMGVTKTGNILEKTTWVLAVSILLLSLASSAFHGDANTSSVTSPNIENARKQILTPSFDDNSLLPAPSDEAPVIEQTPEEEKEGE